MGQVVNKLFSAAAREVKMYNIEKRAEKVISKEKPTPAPMHPSSVKELERFKSENVSMDYIYNKDEKLDEYLKKVFVTAGGPTPSLKRLENPLRPLPQNRQSISSATYGYSEAEEEIVPEGKVSLKQALQFIAAHQTDSETCSKSTISEKYKLDLKTTEDILEHFKMFNVHFKQKGVDPESLNEHQKLNLRLKTMNFVNAWDVMEELKPAKRKFFKIKSEGEDGTKNSLNNKDNTKKR